MPLKKAAIAGITIGVVIAFLLALRAGIVAAPLVTLILWRAISTRTLILIAGALLCIVTPIIDLIFLANDRGGYNYGYASQQEAAHWVAVAGLLLLAIALWREVLKRAEIK